MHSVRIGIHEHGAANFQEESAPNIQISGQAQREWAQPLLSVLGSPQQFQANVSVATHCTCTQPQAPAAPLGPKQLGTLFPVEVVHPTASLTCFRPAPNIFRFQ